MKYAITALFTFIIFVSCTISNAIHKAPANSFRQDFLNQINHLREKGCNCGSTYMPPVGPVSWNSQLEAAAFAHANDMSAKKYFSHQSKDGKTLKDRVAKEGYTINGFRSLAIGENIAWGQRSTNEVMNSWIKSELHCKNLMNSTFKEVGIAEKNQYWVQDFGGRETFPKKHASPRKKPFISSLR